METQGSAQDRAGTCAFESVMPKDAKADGKRDKTCRALECAQVCAGALQSAKKREETRVCVHNRNEAL